MRLYLLVMVVIYQLFWINSAFSEDFNSCPIVRSLTGDGGPPDPIDFSLEEDGVKFKAALKYARDNADLTEEVRAEAITNGRSKTPAIRYSAEPCTKDTCIPRLMQKIHHNIIYARPREKWMRDPSTDLSIQFSFRATKFESIWNLIAQLWQGSPHSPPLSMILRREDYSGRLVFEIDLRNDKTGSNPGATPIRVISFNQIQIGRWYDVILDFSPFIVSLPRRLSVVVRNELGENVASNTLMNQIGYSGRCTYAGSCVTRKPNPFLDFSIGIYRRQYAGQDIIDFDDVRIRKIDSKCTK